MLDQFRIDYFYLIDILKTTSEKVVAKNGRLAARNSGILTAANDMVLAYKQVFHESNFHLLPVVAKFTKLTMEFSTDFDIDLWNKEIQEAGPAKTCC